MARVYVSSTFSDLKECRQDVSAVLRRLGHEAVGMEDYVAQAHRPLDVCLRDVASCDLYLGIFAFRYGHVPTGQQKSITELEFRQAVGLGKDCLVFLLRENAPWPVDRVEIAAYDRVMALRGELAEHYLTTFFTGRDDLQARVTEAVAKWGRGAQSPEHGSRTERRPFQAPPLPAHYVERTETVRGVAAELCADPVKVGGVLVVSALYGLGGVGKTTIAAAVAHDADVQGRFPDGVYWTTLGQEPDCLSQLVAWIQAAGGEAYRPTTIAAATQYLRTLLHSARALLVLDDVWEPVHANAFLVGGPGCRMLVTTRRALISDELGAQVFPLDAMTEPEAVALLRKRVEKRGNTINLADLSQVAALSREVGHLPLALELMGALVARGYSWEQARLDVSLERERHDGRAGSSAHSRLEACLRVSINWLRREDPAAWEFFAWLGVLPDDTPVTAQLAATLWGVDESEAAEMLNALADEAIVQRNARGFAVHDLMHDMAWRILTGAEPTGLGLPAAAAHRQFVGRYAALIPGQGWGRLPPDGYIHARLHWHLRQTGDPDASHDLLAITTPEGQNGWYHARQALGQTAGFLEDVHAAWRAEREAEHSSLCRQVLYAQIVSSMHSLARTISPAVVPTLVERGVWSPAQGLDRLRQILDPDRRVNGLIRLLGVLARPGSQDTAATEAMRQEVLREALEVVSTRLEGYRKAEFLARLAVHATGEQRAHLATEAVEGVRETPSRYREIAGVLPPGPWLNTLLEMTTNAEDRVEISEVIQAGGAQGRRDADPPTAFAIDQFTRHLKKAWRYDIEQAIGYLSYLPSPRDAYVRQFVEALPFGLPEQHGELLTRVRAFASPELRSTLAAEFMAEWGVSTGALCVLAEAETDHARRAERYDEILVHLEGLTRADERDAAMAAVVRTCPVEIVQRAVRLHLRIGDARERAGILFVLAPHLRDGLPSGMMGAMDGASGDAAQIAVLTRLVSDLSQAIHGHTLDEFVQDAAQMVSEWWIVEAMTLLLHRLEEPEQIEAMLRTAGNLRTPDLRSRIIGRIAMHLARLGLTADAIEAAWVSPLPADRARTLADVASQLACDGGFSQAALVAEAIADRDEHDRACSTLCLHLASHGQVDEARKVAAALTVGHWRRFAESRLDSLRDASPPSGTRVTARPREPAPRAGNPLNVDAIVAAATAARDDGVTAPELAEIVRAAERNDVREARAKAAAFWAADAGGGKTYLEIMAAQPRPVSLTRLRKAGPLMTLALEEGEVDAIADHIHQVAVWWP